MHLIKDSTQEDSRSEVPFVELSWDIADSMIKQISIQILKIRFLTILNYLNSKLYHIDSGLENKNF